MERNDQIKIAKHTGLSESTVRSFFKGKSVKWKTFAKITNACHQLHIPAPSSNHTNLLIDRWDIYNSLPRGAKTRIAKKCNCGIMDVIRILEGKKEDKFGVIKEAELEAAINIWKTRFCKYESQL